jgi:hypothetical protein
MLARSNIIIALACLVVVSACRERDPDRAEKIAKAFDNTPTPATNTDQSARMKELKAKAEEKANQAHADELKRITTVATLPADLDTACADVGAGLDAFMTKRLAGDELSRWAATKEPDMRKATEECKQEGKLEVGACFANGLREASIAEFANGSQGEIKAECAKRYGGPPAGMLPS